MHVALQDEYDVLRLIEHNQSCYISSGCVRGRPLIQWLKYHRSMEKQELFQKIAALAKQLGRLHKCRKQNSYQQVNPYSIIIGEDGGVYFLDLGALSNEEALRRMQRRAVRELFLPEGGAAWQKNGTDVDIYGFGKTVQYLLSEAEPEPRLRKWVLACEAASLKKKEKARQKRGETRKKGDRMRRLSKRAKTQGKRVRQISYM